MIVTFGSKRRVTRQWVDVVRTHGCVELDARHSGGLTVRLLWDRVRDQVIVHVRDELGRRDFALNPPKSMARYAFQHPFGVADLFRWSPGMDGGSLAA